MTKKLGHKIELEQIQLVTKETTNCTLKESIKDLKTDHDEFKRAIVAFTEQSRGIRENTKMMVEQTSSLNKIINEFKDDSKKNLEIIAELNKNNNESFKIIAGKKQVPLPIFIIVVGMLCGLLLASEVHYNGVNIELSWNGIRVTTSK